MTQIKTVEVIPISTKPTDDAFGGARGKTNTRSSTLVRLEADDGTVGWGEAFATPRVVATLIEDVFEESVVGLSPNAVETLAEQVYTGQIGGYHEGRQGYTQCALSGVETAMWDIRGKQSGEPVHVLLGSNRTDSVVPYASTMYHREDDHDPAESIYQVVEEGFTAAKIKIGSGFSDDVARVRVAREILGDDAQLMVDYNGNYTPQQAIQSIHRIEEFDLTWVEEPVPPENVSGYSEVKQRVDVPLAAGEAHYSRFEFKRLIDRRLIDVLQPNVSKCGGLREAQFLAKLATTENILVRPHVWSSGVGVAAALQFAAALPSYPSPDGMAAESVLFEFDRSENPLRSEILETPFDPSGGSLAIPQEPGLGITVDEAAVREFRI